MLAVFQGHAEARRKVQGSREKPVVTGSCATLAQAFADMLGLLSHENADIATDVLELFKELTEEDVVQDSVGCCEPICIEPASTYKIAAFPLPAQQSAHWLPCRARHAPGCLRACIRCKTFDRCARRSSRSPADKPALTYHTLRLAPSCRKLMFLQEEGAAALVDWTSTRWSCWCSASEGSST